MSKIKLKHILNTAIIVWLVIWVYYLIFNWDVFVIKLDTNLGFTVIGSYPFIFFFLAGLLLLVLLRYFDAVFSLKRKSNYKDLNNKITLLKKDIEVLKLRETLYKMQSEESSRNDENLKALHQKLDEISSELEGDRKGQEKEAKHESKEDKEDNDN